MDNKLIEWSLSIIVQICGNNRLFLVWIVICYQPTLVAVNYTWWAVQYGRFYVKQHRAVHRR